MNRSPSDPRKPSETRPARMTPLARLPLFYALDGRRVLVAGGSDAVAWKVELLAAAGAHVAVFAHEPSDALREAARDVNAGRVTIHERDWRAEDFSGAALAIGGCENDEDAQRFAEAARRAGVPVNVIDKPAFCDFAFGAIVNRSPLVIGISTDGAAPVFGQAIRAKIEAMLPRGLAAWAQAARDWRPRVQGSGLPGAAKRAFWRAFSDRALARPNTTPTDMDFDAISMSRSAENNGGSVVLVGAGPGDPELLTLRALRALQSADIILYDDLVSAEVLDFARREAKKMLVGKTGYGPSCKQPEINAMMVSLAKAGKRVVRLKGGDPMLFGRAGEEIEACRVAGISVEVVPGITAAQGAASALGVSLTQRRDARRVQYLTGHGADGKLPADIDWKSVSDPSATTIVYMPARTLGELAARAIAHGLDPSTPAIAVSRATRPDQTVLASTIAGLPQRLGESALPGPLLVMIGRTFSEVASSAGQGVATGASSESTFRISS